jgi:hypothetical protein
MDKIPANVALDPALLRALGASLADAHQAELGSVLSSAQGDDAELLALELYSPQWSAPAAVDDGESVLSSSVYSLDNASTRLSSSALPASQANLQALVETHSDVISATLLQAA